MKTSGTFFLRTKPYPARLNSPTEGEVRGWMLCLGECSDHRAVDLITATWRGQEAELFLLQHALKPGDCLQLELDHLHAFEGELRGRITSCRLAPSRWPRHEPNAAAPGKTPATAMTAARPAAA